MNHLLKLPKKLSLSVGGPLRRRDIFRLSPSFAIVAVQSLSCVVFTYLSAKERETEAKEKLWERFHETDQSKRVATHSPFFRLDGHCIARFVPVGGEGSSELRGTVKKRI
ncbi:unnamed protein product [Microthlaspi erraticum]|uniref:Uncharacterized protein n=1 Tax=Microthlaspi erraticum TaxID=1685480 RepID=A0A6D2HQA7_9BRAS|nr:unnamed protein product [Microthlaspi erraticum]